MKWVAPGDGVTWTETLYNDPASSELGAHYFPNNSGLGGEFNQGHPLFDFTTNKPGGVSFVTFLHEIGHGLGLDHPFEDNPFPGVTPNDPQDTGDNQFNNGFYTVMSYGDDPWFAVAPSYSYGYAATPMAFDIAAIQEIYGANWNTATGNNVYQLPRDNRAGTFWKSIWDASGFDVISGANNDGDVVIDLRAATLLNEEGGGGRPSWQKGVASFDTVYGGFSIANGVIIEMATGGSGDDEIHGNEFGNVLRGLGGDDVIYGGAGDNRLIGGTGSDLLYGGDGSDLFIFESRNDFDGDEIHDFNGLYDAIDLSAIDANRRQRFTFWIANVEAQVLSKWHRIPNTG